MSTNIKTNQVNDVIENELKFYSSNSLSNNPSQDPLSIVNISLRGSKKFRQTLISGLTFLVFIVVQWNHQDHDKV